jgi:hypothetical protein
METICGRFVEFLGHDNMAIVTFQNGRDWRDEMIKGELASGTIAVYLKMVKRLFAYAFENELISSNPMSRVKYSPGQGEERDDFSHDERRRILILAREADLYGAFPVKRLLLGFAHSSLFGAGKAVLHPVACDPVPGARGRGQGTETLAELGGLPP